MLSHEFEIAERAAGRGDERLVAGRLGGGQRGLKIGVGVIERAGDAVGLAAPRQRLRFEIGVTQLTREADRLRPLPRRHDAIAGAERRRPGSDLVARQCPVIRRPRRAGG